MIIVLGDIHFRDDKDYFKAVSEKFLEWFNNWKNNNSNNTLILAGDLVETSLLSGNVADYLERFSNYSKFKEIHICCGNHDKKKFHNDDQLAYEFYKNKSNIFIYEEPTEVVIEGLNTLILPYYTGVNKYGKSMNEFYSSIYENKNFSGTYDLVVGHFCGEEFSYYGSADCIKNLDKINTKKLILGHIHTRESNKETYIGSVFACKKSENDYTRSAMIYNNSIWSEEKLPLFNEFITITYPEELPKTKALIPIYTVLNCSSDIIAKSKYNNIFIKRTTTELIDAFSTKKTDLDRQFSSIKEMDISELFKAYINSQETPLDKDIIEDCKRFLKIS